MRIKVEDLPRGENSAIFNGHEQGASVSFFLSSNRQGSGPSLHQHDYEETFIVQEGDVLFTLGDEEIEAGPGDIIVVPAGTPHKFVSRGETHRQISIHPVPRMKTQWLD